VADEEDDEKDEKDDSGSSKKPGCGTAMFLSGIAAVAGGGYMLNRWETLNGAARSAAIILVVLGTLALLPFVLLLAVRVIFKVVFGKLAKDLGKSMEELKKAGGDMVAGIKALYGQIHEFRNADDEDFESVDRKFYDDAQQRFAELGFRHLGDIVDQTIEQTNGLTTVVRVMSSTDGSTTAGVYHFKPPMMPRGFEGKDLVMVDLSTEFSDGTFLLTSNTKGLDLTTTPTGLHRMQHELTTPIEQLVAAHETEKQKLLAAKQGATVVTINTLSDALESEKRQQAVKNAFRKQIGYVDPEEVRRIASRVDESGVTAEAAAQAADEAGTKAQGTTEDHG
jgi:hypothetical protein